MNEFYDVTQKVQTPRAVRRSRYERRYRYVRLRWHVLLTAIDFVGGLLFAGARLIRRIFNGGKHEPGTVNRPRSILVVQLDHLGDAVLSTGLLRALRNAHPQARIEVLCGAANRELFYCCPEVNRVHAATVHRFARQGKSGWVWSLIAWGWRLRRRRFDWAIDVRGELPNAALLWLTGARRRIGWNCGGGGFLLTDSPRYVPGRPEALSRQSLLDVSGIAPPSGRNLWAPRFTPSNFARAAIEMRLAGWREPGRPLLVMHIGAGMTAKQWPAVHWQELLGRAIVERAAQVVLVGSSSDQDKARLVTGDRAWPGVADWTGRLRIDELAALLERADAFVGADSGPAHLAAAVGTAVVAIFSGTNDPAQWRPWGRQVEVVRHATSCTPCHREACPLAHHPCLREVTPAAVMAALDRSLAPSLLSAPHRWKHSPLETTKVEA